MNEARYFKAPWSQWLVIMSTIASVLCVGLDFVPHLRVYPLAPSTIRIAFLFGLLILPAIAFAKLGPILDGCMFCEDLSQSP